MTKQQLTNQNYAQVQKDRVKKAMEEVAYMFANEQFFISDYAKTFLTEKTLPCDKWSTTNRMRMLYIGKTRHAGNMNYWNANGRRVNKGEKAFWIIQPKPYTIKEPEVIDGKKTGKMVERTIMFWNAVPEFAYSQTSGKQMDHVEIPKEVPPLMDLITKEHGIEVTYDRTDGDSYGYTDHKKIVLSNHDPSTLYHEAIHMFHLKVLGTSKYITVSKQEKEIIAEFGAAVLSAMYCTDKKQKIVNNAYNYIKFYLSEGGEKKVTQEDIGKYCVKVMGTVEKIINKLLKNESEV